MIKKVVVLGLGRIGGTIAKTLNNCPDYEVIGADISPQAAQFWSNEFETRVIEKNAFEHLLEGQDAVISALTFNENPEVARACLKHGCSYFDLTEDVECTRAIMEIAKDARPGQVFMPQCGLAPGFVGILGYSFHKEFDQLDSLKMRVGALPEFPSNQMMYNMTWSTEGLVNEYANPCEAIKKGQKTMIEPLEGREVFSVSGVEYEAFNTSGGLGNLCNTLDGKIRELTYKTIRYPGHNELMRFLFNDLRLGEAGERRNMLMSILDSSVAVTRQDLVLISNVATGYIDGKLEQRSRTFCVKHTADQSAIQISTTSGALTVLDLILQGKIERTGFVEQEAVDVEMFLANRFAEPYRKSELGSIADEH